MKKIILKIGIACLSIFVALSALFVPLKKSNNIDSASAYSWRPNGSTASIFTTSDYICSPIRFNATASVQDNSVVSMSSLNNLPNNVNMSFCGFSFNIEKTPYRWNVQVKRFDAPTFTSAFVNNLIGHYEIDNRAYYYNPLITTLSTGNNFKTIFYILCDNISNGVSKAVEQSSAQSYYIYSDIGSSLDFNDNFIAYDENSLEYSQFTTYIDTDFNYFSYVDQFYNRITIFVPISGSSDLRLLDYRRYYYSNENIYSDNQMYNQGLQDGYTNGYQAGEIGGYNSGYNAGEIDGFNAGKIEGANQANTYTFVSLIGAVVDVPLNAFKSLFNFDILGINLFNFFSALLTCCLIIFILKLALGGK